ncbi:MAG: O-antigen ligase family protein [Candidatus Omnitrophica bacterium]|nr:O-antigen ligase family protein [Candidatus Omnitrophota bacterium]
MPDNFKKIIQLCFIILIFVNIFSFNRTGEFDYKSLYLETVSAVLFLIWCLGLLLGKVHFKNSNLDLLVLIFFFINLISFLFSPYKLASAVQFYQVFIYTGIYFAFLSAFRDLEDIQRFINFLSLSIIFVSLYGILQYFGYDPLRLSHKGILISTFVNKNFLGGVLAINLPFCFANLFLTKRFFYFWGFLAVIYALILTGSKGGIFVGFMGIFLYFLFYFVTIKDKIPILRRKGFSILLILIIFIILVRSSAYTHDSLMSLKERFPFWRLSLRMVKEHPFKGTGIGNFVLFAPYYKGSIFHPEQFIRHSWNEFLQVWVELGFVGFLIFIILSILAFFSGFRFIFQCVGETTLKSLSLAGLTSLFSGILLNLGEINLRIVYLGIYFWINLAILSKIREIKKDISIFTFRFSPLLKGILCSLFIFGIFSLLKFSLTPLWMLRVQKNNKPTLDIDNLEKKIKDTDYNNLGNLCLLKGDIDKAEKCYQRILAINPRSPSANYNLGYLYFLQGKIKEAYERFSFCLKINPCDTEAYFMIKKNILY